MWSAREEPGLGHLLLAVRNSGIVADGVVLGMEEGRPFRLSYEVRCDPYCGAEGQLCCESTRKLGYRPPRTPNFYGVV
jgi:hypothetical protein